MKSIWLNSPEVSLAIRTSRVFIKKQDTWKQIKHNSSINNQELIKNNMNSKFKFALVMAFIVTSYISFILVSINAGFREGFLLLWLRSWCIAYILAVPSLIFIPPFIKQKLKI